MAENFADADLGPAMAQRIRRPEDIGALIKSRREDLGYDQQALATLLGVSRRWLWSVESGKPRVQLDLVLRCLNELKIQVWAGDLAPPEPNPYEMAKVVADQEASAIPTIDIDSIADMGLEKESKRSRK